ncbi:MAG TPA: hypothetical protein VHZ04_00205 [Candidatus Paceibacterota bacterium]|nr:hypothetical protein [Candidatus Paceibacterota bacterium]
MPEVRLPDLQEPTIMFGEFDEVTNRGTKRVHLSIGFNTSDIPVQLAPAVQVGNLSVESPAEELP